METHVSEFAVLLMIALLFAAVVQMLWLARERRRLEDRLVRSQVEITSLRHRLADATRPPTQFARMRVRQEAVARFDRLRRAVPRRQPVSWISR